MAVQTIIKNTVNLDEPIKKQILTDVLGGSDNQAHRFEVALTRGGAAVDLTGAEVYGYFIRPGDITVKLTGGVTGNTAYVVLNEHCYVTPGRFSFAMKIQVGEVLHTVLLYEGNVAVTQGEGVVDDGYVIPSLTEWMNNIRKPNLLDNSDFRIAQAGYGGKHGENKYACDRWLDRYGFGAFSFDENKGLTISYGTNHAYATQRIYNASRYHGKVMTLAVGMADGTVHVKSEKWLSDATSFAIYFDNAMFYLHTNSVELVVSEGSLSIKWVALYEGSYTAETLPAYQPKGYAAELAECQRYYQQFGFDLSKSGVNATDGYPERIPIQFDMPMRIVPTVTMSKSWDSGLAKEAGADYITKSGMCLSIVSVDTTAYVEWHGTIACSADL